MYINTDEEDRGGKRLKNEEEIPVVSPCVLSMP